MILDVSASKCQISLRIQIILIVFAFAIAIDGVMDKVTISVCITKKF